MVYLGWDVYRWAVRQMQIQPDAVKDELRVFLGSHPHFKEIEDYLPTQRGKELDGSHLDLKKHQIEALKSLQAMRDNSETIALLYHATGTGKTVTAVMDAKNCGGRTLFLAHTQELVNQAAETFRKLWPSVTVGRYVESMKQPNAHVVCGSVQSVALHLDEFQDDAFDYVAKLNEWYNAGYIDPEFMSNDGTSMNAKLTDGRSVAGTNMQLSYHIGNITTAARETNPEFEFVGCPWPVLNEGDEPSYYMPNGVAYSGKQAAITSACEDPALAVQILDFFYSEEGEDLLTWGIEGESYQVNEDGTKSFTDNIMNNPDGKNPQEAIIEYATPQYNFANVMMEEPYVEIITTLPEQREARSTWLDAVDGVNLPYLTVDPEVQSDYTMLMNDITTYVQETYIQFITGQVDLESGWENYVNTLNGMGLETVTQYMADAYALYQQR